MSLESFPPGAMPFIAAVVAGVIGYLLWRIFQVALKIVAFIVFVIVMVGVFAWWQPELFGFGKQVIEDQMGPLPTVDEAAKALEEKAKAAAKEAAREAIRDAVNETAPPSAPAPRTTK